VSVATPLTLAATAPPWVIRSETGNVAATTEPADVCHRRERRDWQRRGNYETRRCLPSQRTKRPATSRRLRKPQTFSIAAIEEIGNVAARMETADVFHRSERVRRTKRGGTFEFEGRPLVGRIRSRAALRLIAEWAPAHRLELEANWTRTKAGRPLERIEPLEQ